MKGKLKTRVLGRSRCNEGSWEYQVQGSGDWVLMSTQGQKMSVWACSFREAITELYTWALGREKYPMQICPNGPIPQADGPGNTKSKN